MWSEISLENSKILQGKVFIDFFLSLPSIDRRLLRNTSSSASFTGRSVGRPASVFFITFFDFPSNTPLNQAQITDHKSIYKSRKFITEKFLSTFFDLSHERLRSSRACGLEPYLRRFSAYLTPHEKSFFSTFHRIYHQIERKSLIRNQFRKVENSSRKSFYRLFSISATRG